MAKIFTRTFRVRWSEIDASQRVSPAQHLEYLVETAYDWGESLGLGEGDSQHLGITWVIRETDIEFLQPLCFNDEFTFTIWMVDWRRVQGQRAFEIHKAEGRAVVARGTQRVACLHQDTLRPVAPPKELIERFRLDNPRTFPGWQLPGRSSQPGNAFLVRRRVEWRDLDVLDHVNNAAYIRIAEEANWRFLDSLGWPPQHLGSEGLGVFPVRMQISYQNLSRWGEELNIAISPIAVSDSGWQTSASITSGAHGSQVVSLHHAWRLVERANDAPKQLPGELRQALGAYIVEGKSDGKKLE